MTVSEYRRYQEKYESARDTKNKCDGIIQSIQESWKKNYEVDSVEEVQALVEKKKKEQEKLQERMDELEDELKQLADWSAL